MSKIISISHARFNALCLSRDPYLSWLYNEIAWFADKKEKVLGVICCDLNDDDFGYAVLGRDEIGMFRAIDMDISFIHPAAAKVELLQKMKMYSASDATNFPQGDVTRAKNEIFKVIVAPEKIHRSFSILQSAIGFSPAKEIIKEAVYAYIDLDGNYVQQFQSDGFDARIWELYLFLAFHEMTFPIKNQHAAPDYVLEYGVDEYMCIEAVTVNPTQNPQDPVPAAPTCATELEILTRGYLPIKFGSALYSKLKKKYWEQAHVAGRPLIFAIADFHQERSMLWSRTALIEYLYGLHDRSYHDQSGNLIIQNEKIESHTYNGKTIPSNFFALPGAEHVSGILFSNQGTIAKFNRMGKLAGFGDPNIKMLVHGFCHDHNPNASKPLPFSFEVTDSKYHELWSEGLSLYHNPNALHPLPKDVFPEEVAQFFLEDGVVKGVVPKFYPYGSETLITRKVVPKKKKKKR